jgi:hypothetical protein
MFTFQIPGELRTRILCEPLLVLLITVTRCVHGHGAILLLVSNTDFILNLWLDAFIDSKQKWNSMEIYMIKLLWYLNEKCILEVTAGMFALSNSEQTGHFSQNLKWTSRHWWPLLCHILIHTIGNNINIMPANRSFENVLRFKYLETTVINQNLIEENRRLNSSNACYLSVQNHFPSSAA